MVRDLYPTALFLLMMTAGCALTRDRVELKKAAAVKASTLAEHETQQVSYSPHTSAAGDALNEQSAADLPQASQISAAYPVDVPARRLLEPVTKQDVLSSAAVQDRQSGEMVHDDSAALERHTEALQLHDVLTSVADCYPLLEIAMAEIAEVEGKTLAAWGSFDTVLSGYTLNEPLGFYENYRHGGKISRPLWNGSEVYGGYRLGRGAFEPWYQERQTNAGGEFKAGVKRPFLKGLAIDARRASLQAARLERHRIEPDIATRIIGMQRAASQAYWKWVASGLATQTQRRLLELAQRRNDALIKQVEEGDLPKITEVDNGRFIAKRQVKLIETQRKVQEAAIKLSLFLRDTDCQPLVATDEMLPRAFPRATPPDPEVVESDIAQALALRPELRDLDFQRRQVEVELCYAQNLTLPKLDGYAEAGQDVGAPSSAKRDKSEFEIEVGLIAEVPLQRRLACGKIKAARAKLAQIAAKRRFSEDKIRSEVLDAVSALDTAYERIEQARENLRLTEQSLRLGRLRFEEGDIDIIALNIYETSLAEAELLVIDAELAYFNAVADYRAALAVEL